MYYHWLLVVTVVAVYAWVLIERVVHAMCLFIWHALFGVESDLKTFSAMLLVTACVNFFLSFLNTMWSVVVATLNIGSSWSVMMLKFALVGVACTFVFEYYPQLVEDIIMRYNGGFGSGFRALVYETSYLGYEFVSIFLPVYNGLIWFGMKLLSIIVIPGVEIDGASFLQMLTSIRDVVVSLVVSLSSYTEIFYRCDGSACFQASNRILDVITPMSHLRLVVGHGLRVVRTNCDIISAPVDLLVYPLTDINFAKGNYGSRLLV